MRRNPGSINDAASFWLGRCDGGLGPAERAEFFQWLRADRRHAEAFARLDAASRALDRLSVLRPAGNFPPDPDLPVLRARRKQYWPAIALAAAAVFAVMVAGRWRPARDPLLYDYATLTGVGGMKKITLPDGSVVNLNTDSGLDAHFTSAERRVRLTRGEADFIVAKNPARPFVVEAHGIAVRAVGTAFDVRLRDESVEVLVTEGRVQVNDVHRGTSLISRPMLASAIGPPVVVAGQRAMIPIAGPVKVSAPVTVTPIEISQRLAWQDRRLEFNPMPLRWVVAEFNRYNRHRLVVADPAIAELEVGGAFRVDDSDAFVRLLESSFGVVAERHGDETVLRTRH